VVLRSRPEVAGDRNSILPVKPHLLAELSSSTNGQMLVSCRRECGDGSGNSKCWRRDSDIWRRRNQANDPADFYVESERECGAGKERSRGRCDHKNLQEPTTHFRPQ
jgi:hypothetical protein